MPQPIFSAWLWNEPRWLWLLPPALLVILWIQKTNLPGFSSPRRLVSLVLRCGIIALLILAATRPARVLPSTHRMTVFAVDVSDSIDAPAQSFVRDFLRQASSTAAREPANQAVYLPFAATAGRPQQDWTDVVSFLGGGAAAAADREAIDGGLDYQATNLETALLAARALIPTSHVPRIVLVSDGNATQGNLEAALQSNHIPIDVVPVPSGQSPEVMVSAIDAPPKVRAGESFEVEVVVDANTDAEGVLDLYQDDVLVSDPVLRQIQTGENRFVFTCSADDQKHITLSARMRGLGTRDTRLDNNQISTSVRATGKLQTLLIDPDFESLNPLRWALESQEISVQIRPSQAAPDQLTDLQAFDCVVLSNVSATELTVRQIALLASYVEDLGGGLVMLGGDQAFGLGGYSNTPLEELSPVRSKFEKDRDDSGLAMVLVLDRSGSMGGQRMAMAKEAAIAATELLEPRDMLGVLAFDTEFYWVSPLQSVQQRSDMIRRISTLTAGGGTNMYPAMRAAFVALQRADSPRKHCILLTDGISEAGDFLGLAAEMAQRQITVTAVAMGNEPDQGLLEDIARVGQGRFYACPDPQSVPQVFAKETMEAGQSSLLEEPFLPEWKQRSDVLSGIDLEVAPFLLGQVATTAKPTSDWILSSDTGEPLLVWWRYGLGKTVAFTSDAKARWGVEWLDWSDFPTFWAQIIRHAARQQTAGGLDWFFEQSAGSGHLQVDVYDDSGGFMADSQGALRVVDADLNTANYLFQPLGPGRHQTRFPIPQDTDCLLEVEFRSAGGAIASDSRRLMRRYPEEWKIRPPDYQTLRRIADQSGGRYAPSVAEIFTIAGPSAAQPFSLWPALLMIAICCFVVDVGVRRMGLAKFDGIS